MDINPILAERFPFMNIRILQSRISWSIHLRWFAIIGFFLATLATKYFFELELLFQEIWLILIVLTVINLVYLLIQKVFKKFTLLYEILFLTLHIIIDLVILTVLIHLSGGIENPIYLFYIFHVVLSSIFLPRWYPYIIATFVIVLFGGLVYVEFTQIIPHYCIFKTDTHEIAALTILILTIFIITVYMTSYICTTFMKIFRESKLEIDTLNKKLVSADQQKTQFYQYTSHELKSPIVAIKSSIDGVIANYADKIEERPLNVLKRASLRSEQMLTILKELLELSRNRILMPQVYNVPVDIHQILKEAIELEKETAEHKNVKIISDIEDTNPLIKGNTTDFEKIFINLIGNAVRYNNDDGEVFVCSQKKSNFLQIQIRDNGIGIHQKDLDNIFKEFYRAENAKKIINFGTGLGLSLVKQIIENYSGSISVVSEVGKGSTFIIYLPLKGSNS